MLGFFNRLFKSKTETKPEAAQPETPPQETPAADTASPPENQTAQTADESALTPDAPSETGSLKTETAIGSAPQPESTPVPDQTESLENPTETTAPPQLGSRLNSGRNPRYLGSRHHQTNTPTRHTARNRCRQPENRNRSRHSPRPHMGRHMGKRCRHRRQPAARPTCRARQPTHRHSRNTRTRNRSFRQPENRNR